MSQELRLVKGKTNGLRYQITHLVQQYYSPSSSIQAAAPSIYWVPDSLRELKPKAYTPRVVSIGLLHSKDECFKHMNKHKESYMSSLFHRTAKSEETRKKDVNKTIHRCVNAMEDEECRVRVRTCYPPSAELDDKSIARLMLVDGCFVLELLTRWWIMDNEDKREINDPIFGNNLVSYDVRLDLLLLENQIPYFILQQLFELTVEQIQNRPNSLSLTDLILECFGHMMNPEFELKIKDGTNENADHILGLLHSCY